MTLVTLMVFEARSFFKKFGLFKKMNFTLDHSPFENCQDPNACGIFLATKSSAVLKIEISSLPRAVEIHGTIFLFIRNVRILGIF